MPLYERISAYSVFGVLLKMRYINPPLLLLLLLLLTFHGALFQSFEPAQCVSVHSLPKRNALCSTGRDVIEQWRAPALRTLQCNAISSSCIRPTTGRITEQLNVPCLLRIL